MKANLPISHQRLLAYLIAGLIGGLLSMTSPFNRPGNANSQMSVPVPPRLLIVTGGQTGVDRAALDTALALFLPVRGWCPKGRLAEDGVIPAIYPMQETTSEAVAVRTEWNVRDADGTLIIAFGELAGGTLLTEQLAQKYQRPTLTINASTFSPATQARFDRWLKSHQIRMLNIAGPRESADPGVIYRQARAVLQSLLQPFAPPL